MVLDWGWKQGRGQGGEEGGRCETGLAGVGCEGERGVQRDRRVREGFTVTGGSLAHPLCTVGERGRRDRCTCCVGRPSSALQDWGGGRGEDKPGVWRATIPKEAKPQPPSSAHTGLPTRSAHSTPPDHQEPPDGPSPLCSPPLPHGIDCTVLSWPGRVCALLPPLPRLRSQCIRPPGLCCRPIPITSEAHLPLTFPSLCLSSHTGLLVPGPLHLLFLLPRTRSFSVTPGDTS